VPPFFWHLVTTTVTYPYLKENPNWVELLQKRRGLKAGLKDSEFYELFAAIGSSFGMGEKLLVGITGKFLLLEEAGNYKLNLQL